jgi:dihydropteroate synthase
MLLRARDREVHFPRRPLVMGIINVNDDSFSGDGTLDIGAALAQAHSQICAGADIIDVGAESARTNREAITAKEELARLRPFIERFTDLAEATATGSGGLGPPLLSVNTWRPEVVREILPMGVDLLNDIGALPDDSNARLCAEHGTALLIMHSVGLPKQPHPGQRYTDIMAELDRFFETKLTLAESAGLERERTLLDPGIDFAKDRGDNLRILREAQRLNSHGRPVLLPISRKTVIGDVLDIDDPTARDAGTMSCAIAGALRGAAVLRVHDVASVVTALSVVNPLLNPTPTRNP